MRVKDVVYKLYEENNATDEELLYLLNNLSYEDKELLVDKANVTRVGFYKNTVYIRGLIEFTNYCIRNCKYCGIRFDNKKAERYRLTKEEIMECVYEGDRLGFKTYVLQGGEDTYFSDDILIDIIKTIKGKYPNNAITLSLGERSYESYKSLFDAGAERYLLRHETANKELYNKLHPNSRFENRIKCLKNLKSIGYQVGSGFMVGLPEQTNEDLVRDLRFLKEFKPHMCGIGPFIPHKDTPLGSCKGGTLEKTTTMIAIIRLLLPDVLLPSTTALGTIHKQGRELGIKAGANVVMPNLSPISVRRKYALYNGKLCTGEESAECRKKLEESMEKIGFKVEIGRGDNINFHK